MRFIQQPEHRPGMGMGRGPGQGRGQGMMGGGMGHMGDKDHMVDMDTIHALFRHAAAGRLRRYVLTFFTRLGGGHVYVVSVGGVP